MIPSESRYRQGTLFRAQTSTGMFQSTVFRTVPQFSATKFTLYVWRATDRPDTVAETFLGSPNLWWMIFDINPEIIYPLNIPAGSVVRIPTALVQGKGTLLQ